MKDLLTQARAVEARLRELEYEMQEEAADTITSLITALEAAQPTFAIDGMTPSQFAMRELYEFQEATGCDTGAQAKGKLEAAQKDAERYRWLKDNRSYHYSMQPDSPAEHGIEYQWQQGTYEERHQGLDGSIDAAIKAQGDAK